MSVDLLALGEPLVEFNQARSGDPTTWRQGFGGDTSNVVIAAARLGARAGYLTRVGDDAFGRMLLELWHRERVDTRGVTVDASGPTGVYFVTHSDHGHAFSYLRAGSAASRMTAADLPSALIRGARVLHVSAISQAISTSACDATFAAMRLAREAGVKVSYDTNLRLALWPLARARETILASLACCDWCLPSLDDARAIFETDDEGKIIDALLAGGATTVVLKRGAKGCIVADGGRRESLAANRVTPVDATGAGDCFDGAFAARMIAGDDAVTAARYANAAAALTTTGYGAVAPLPRDADVRALLAAAQLKPSPVR